MGKLHLDSGLRGEALFLQHDRDGQEPQHRLFQLCPGEEVISAVLFSFRH